MSHWKLSSKFALRFSIIFIAIQLLPEPFYYLPIIDMVTEYYTQMMYAFVPWFADTFLDLGYEITVFPGGSGDTTYNYVVLLIAIIFGLLGAAIWSFVDRKRTDLDRLQYWINGFVRFTLFNVMFSYGLAKVFGMQFGFPGVHNLVQPLGEMAPMRVAWNFMGYSYPYLVFTGVLEVTAGLLMLTRKTTVIGAAASAAVMLNVFMMNMCFDIPVKLYSGLLLFMSLFLLAPQLKRLTQFFFLNQATAPVNLGPEFTHKAMIWARRIGKGFIILIFIPLTLVDSYDYYSEEVVNRGTNLFNDEYRVETMIQNGDTLPPLTTDTVRWQKFFSSYEGQASVTNMQGQRGYFLFEIDSTDEKHITLQKYRDSTMRYDIHYQLQDSLLTFHAINQNDTFEIRMLKHKREDYTLVNRGFHWINEYPYNN